MCSDACFFPFVFDWRALFANWFSSSRLRSTRLDVENGLKSNNNRPRAVSAQLKQLHVAHINKTHPFWSLTSATRRYGLAPRLPLCPHALPSSRLSSQQSREIIMSKYLQKKFLIFLISDRSGFREGEGKHNGIWVCVCVQGRTYRHCKSRSNTVLDLFLSVSAAESRYT